MMDSNVDQLKILSLLPVNQYSLMVASKFSSLREFQRFSDVYKILNKSEVLHLEHMQRISSGECPQRLIEVQYLDLPFPAPVVIAPDVRYAANGHDLVAIAQDFNNCLQGFVAAALHGESQYYVWIRAGTQPIVFEIANDAPLGWYLADCHSYGECKVSKDARQELEDMLRGNNVRSGGSMAWLMRPFRKKVTEPDVVTFPDGAPVIR
jgi:hypothetical protein